MPVTQAWLAQASASDVLASKEQKARPAATLHCCFAGAWCLRAGGIQPLQVLLLLLLLPSPLLLQLLCRL
jgi:hypothetical protein